MACILVGKTIPLYGFEEFFEFCADWEIGVLCGLIGSLDGGLPWIVVIVVGVLPGWLFAFF